MTGAERPRAVAAPIRFQVGARTLATIPRTLVRVGVSLDEVLAGTVPVLPGLRAADGYMILSLPEAFLGGVERRERSGVLPVFRSPRVAVELVETAYREVVSQGRSLDTGSRQARSLLETNGKDECRSDPDLIKTDGLIAHVRQRYVRYYTDLSIGHAAWLAAMSGNARAGLKRKAKKLAGAGRVEVRAYRTAEELAAFHALARPLSAATYQERLLDAGLPDGAAFLTRQAALAAADAVRAWLLLLDGKPAAYLWCSAQGTALRYDHVGHDPTLAALSPGTVLHAEAMRMLFDDRFARFDFTEGEGQHKRQFATDGVPCLDLMLLRPTLANRAALVALGGFDAAMATAKTWTTGPRLQALAKRVRRA